MSCGCFKQKPESWRLACQTIVGNKENSGKVCFKIIVLSTIYFLKEWNNVNSNVNYDWFSLSRVVIMDSRICYVGFLGGCSKDSSMEEVTYQAK